MALKSEFTPYEHDDLPEERNYVSDLLERYLKDMLNRRNYEINPNKEIQNLLRRQVRLDEIETMIQGVSEHALQIVGRNQELLRMI